MIVDECQRWRDRRPRFRPAGEVIDPRHYEIAPIASDNVARAFVERHHYSASYPAARERVGLYRAGELVGVAVFSMPAQSKALDILPCPRTEAVELGRLVLTDDVPGNGESYFVARALELVRREGFAGVVSFADPVPRRGVDGRLILPGHRGIVYQATNAVYTGRGAPATLWLLPSGAVFANRTRSKIRNGEVGGQAAVEQLIAEGAGPPAPGDDPAAWVCRELRRIARSIRHRGCHRYLLPLDRACRRALPAHLERRGVRVQPYPRAIDAEPIAKSYN